MPAVASHARPAPFLPTSHADDDVSLGQALLSTVRAQRAFRAAGVESAWNLGRAAGGAPGQKPARVIGVVFAGRPSADLVLEHLAQLEHVLKAVCAAPVTVRCYFQSAAVPAGAVPVPVHPADRPALPQPPRLDGAAVVHQLTRPPAAAPRRLAVAACLAH